MVLQKKIFKKNATATTTPENLKICELVKLNIYLQKSKTDLVEH